MTSNICTPVANTFGCRAVTFCAWKVTSLFSVVFCVIRTVNKFDFHLVMDETPKKQPLMFVTVSVSFL